MNVGVLHAAREHNADPIHLDSITLASLEGGTGIVFNRHSVPKQKTRSLPSLSSRNAVTSTKRSPQTLSWQTSSTQLPSALAPAILHRGNTQKRHGCLSVGKRKMTMACPMPEDEWEAANVTPPLVPSAWTELSTIHLQFPNIIMSMRRQRDVASHA